MENANKKNFLKNIESNIPKNIFENNKIFFGAFSKPILNLNFEQNHGYKELWLQFRKKHWQYISVNTQDVFVSLAIANAGFATDCFVCVFEPNLKKLWLWHFLVPPILFSHIAESSVTSQSYFRFGKFFASITNQTDSLNLLISAPASKKLSKLDVSARLTSRLSPLVALIPLSAERATYTHKACCFELEGDVSVGDRHYGLNNGFGFLDYTKGYFLRKTFWNWAAASGKTNHGTLFGFNLVHNPDYPEYHENVFWYGDKMVRFDKVLFYRDQNDLKMPWSVTSVDKRVYLKFEPVCLKQKNMRTGLINDKFSQLFGFYSGTFDDQQFSNVLGVIEERDSLW